MAIDLLNIQPTVISKNLKGKYVLIYSQPKMGKTTLACQFPKNLLLAFEKGYNAIGGVKAVDIIKWSDLKLVLRQLEKPEVREMYDTITIDTVQIAWDLCEKYICAQAGVQNLADIPWGGGYAQLSKEFEDVLRRITMLGYGLVLITHVDVRKEKVGDNEVEYYTPALNKRCYPICNRIVDIIGYIDVEWDDEGNSKRWLYTRKTKNIMAGSRFKYLAPRIEFGYQELINAISDAIEKSEKYDGAKVVDTAVTSNTTEEKLDYNQLRQEAEALWGQLISAGGEDMAKRIMKRVEMIFGRQIKLSEITEDQVDLFNLVILDMRDLLGSL